MDKQSALKVIGGATPATVSYAMNSNIPRGRSLSEAESFSHTVQLFEVTGNLAQITVPDEGLSKGLVVGGQMSATGDGTYGSIMCYPAIWAGKGQGRFTRYATGVLDNAGSRLTGDDYQNEPARHNDGANWLALDSHVTFARPLMISAGLSAKTAGDQQSAKGCKYHPKQDPEFACAEGTAVGKHKLTFSLR